MRVNKGIQKCVSILGIMALLFTSAPVYAGEPKESTAYEAEVVTGDTAEIVEAEEDVIEEAVVEPEAEEGTEEITVEEEAEASADEEEAEAAVEASTEPVAEIKGRNLNEKIKYAHEFLCGSYEVPTPRQPVFSQVKSSGYNSVYLKWNAVDCSYYHPAHGYEIYRSTDQENYEMIADIDDFGDYLDGKSEPYPHMQFETKNGKLIGYYTYIDKGTDKERLSTGKTYYYKLVAYNYHVDSTGKILSKMPGKASAVKSVTPIPKTPTIKVTNVDESKLKLTWSKVSGANGYVIQRSTKKDSGYKTIKTITDGSTVTYTNSKLSLGKTYYYKVRAYCTVDGQKLYSNYSGKKSLQVKLKKPVIKNLKETSTKAIKITWDKVNKAQGYVIYSATSYNGAYKKHKTIKGGIKISTTADPDYYYKIRAYRKVNRKTVYSPYSAII